MLPRYLQDSALQGLPSGSPIILMSFKIVLTNTLPDPPAARLAIVAAAIRSRPTILHQTSRRPADSLAPNLPVVPGGLVVQVATKVAQTVLPALTALRQKGLAAPVAHPLVLVVPKVDQVALQAQIVPLRQALKVAVVSQVPAPLLPPVRLLVHLQHRMALVNRLVPVLAVQAESLHRPVLVAVAQKAHLVLRAPTQLSPDLLLALRAVVGRRKVRRARTRPNLALLQAPRILHRLAAQSGVFLRTLSNRRNLALRQLASRAGNLERRPQVSQARNPAQLVACPPTPQRRPPLVVRGLRVRYVANMSDQSTCADSNSQGTNTRRDVKPPTKRLHPRDFLTVAI